MSTFLNGDLEEKVYIEQPKGYMKKGKKDKVYCLQKELCLFCLDPFKAD